MIINNINLVELVAEGDNLLTDSENTNTFKKITCRAEDVNKYREVTKEKAQEIMLAVINRANDFIENLVDKLDGVIDIQN